MELGLKGKRALVQGASAGLGFAVAQALAREGARVAICSRDEGRIQDAARRSGAELALTCDLARPGASRQLVEDVCRKLGGVDILVTNAGGPPKGSFEELTEDKWQEGFRSLWLSAVESIQAALPGMRKQGWGRVLAVTSVAAKEPMPQLTVSNGLRAGLLGLLNSLSQEVAADGITVNALLPGYTDTERLRELGVALDRITSQIPARRLGRAEEFGDLAAFLASERAAYVTGQAIACDGGYLRGI
jgi:3-oxoacyl-[acyl-carrier protein] reductase